MSATEEQQRQLFEALNEEIELTRLAILAMGNTDEERRFVEWASEQITRRPNHCGGCMGQFMGILIEMTKVTVSLIDDLHRIGPLVVEEMNQSAKRALYRVFTHEEIEEDRQKIVFENIMRTGGQTGNPNN